MEVLIPDLLHALQDLKDIKLYHRNLTIGNIAKINGRYVILDLSMSRNAVGQGNQSFVLSGRSLCHEVSEVLQKFYSDIIIFCTFYSFQYLISLSSDIYFRFA